MLPVAILCGGFGTRLGEITRHTQKCLVEVGGRPFLEHVLESLRRQGGERVVLCIGHLGDQVRDVVGDGSRFGLDVAYSDDGEQPCGTAAALRKAAPLLADDFFVMYGDSYLTLDLRPIETVYERRMLSGLMVVCEPPSGYKPNAWLERGMIREYDKHTPNGHMGHIDYGLSVIHRNRLTGPMTDLSDYFTRFAAMGELAGYLSAERFYTVGSPDSLELTREHLASVSAGGL